jgi:F-type H+-transporting ATPase subunit epsilon
MRLRIATPSQMIVDAADVVAVRAEDSTGLFGIEERHAEFVTTLALSVLSWRDARGQTHHAAVRGGALRVERGGLVEVAARDAVLGDDLEDLERNVLTRLREDASADAKERTRAAQLDAAVVRQLHFYVRTRRSPRSLTLGRRQDEEQS